jgi:hypothetical protein
MFGYKLLTVVSSQVAVQWVQKIKRFTVWDTLGCTAGYINFATDCDDVTLVAGEWPIQNGRAATIIPRVTSLMQYDGQQKRESMCGLIEWGEIFSKKNLDRKLNIH